jgi:hypothetical protein
MAADYCTIDNVTAFAQDDDMNTVTLGILIGAVSRAIDNVCHRSFSAVAASRPYDFEDATHIRLREDLASLTQVTTNAGQTLLASNFSLRPLNGPPYRYIKVKEGTGAFLQYTGSRDEAITVTGVWGRISVPADIKTAAIIWTANLYMTSDVRGLQGVSGDAMSAQIAQALETPPADTLPFLKPYRRITIAALGDGALGGRDGRIRLR